MLGTTYFYCAAIGGIFLIVQLLSMFMGGDDGADGVDVDVDVDVDGDGADHDAGWWILEVVSLRTLAAASMFFGLTGITAEAYELNSTVGLALSVAAGWAAMYAVYWAFKQMLRLQSSGRENIRNAVGKTGNVYVPIPAESNGAGKVHFEMQGRTVEYQAKTDDPQQLATGQSVQIMEIIDHETLLVRAIES